MRQQPIIVSLSGTLLLVTKLLAIAAVLLLGRTSGAQTQQPWLSDRRYGEGAGIRSGNLELHPGVAAETGYDSNFFQAAGADPDPSISEPVIPVARLRITPSLSLRTLGPERRAFDGPDAQPPKANFDLGASLRVDELFALDEADAPATRETLIGGNAFAELDVGPREPFGASLGASFSRVEHPTNDPALTSAAFDRNRFGGHLDLRFRPGGGILSWSLGYAGAVTQYDNVDFALDRAEHGIRTQGRFRFMPRTAVIYEGEFGFITQLHANSRQADAQPISSQLGLNGLITPRIALLVMGGVKAMFFEPNAAGVVDDFDGFIGRVEGTWFLGASDGAGIGGPEDRGLSHLRVGFQRDVFAGGIGNFYTLNRGFAELLVVGGGVVVVTARGGLSVISHSPPRTDQGVPLTEGGSNVVEQRPELGLYAEYRLTSTIALLANTEFVASQPENFVLVSPTTGAQDNLEFVRFTALFGARWFL